MRVLKVLIVDDDPDGLGVLVEQVRRLGQHEMTACFSALEAQKLILDGETFDVIMTDNDMPKMSGVELLRWFVTESFGATTLVLMSGNPTEEVDELIRENPEIVLLHKPIKLDALMQHFGS